METRQLITELGESVKNFSEFEMVVDDLITEYCEELYAMPNTTRPVTEDDIVEDGVTFIWEPSSVKLIEAKIKELQDMGKKYFGQSASIHSHMYIK